MPKYLFTFLTCLSLLIDTCSHNDVMQTDKLKGKIVFVSNRDGQYHIYVMNADGSSQHRLTQSLASERNPVWSPDGKRIAFVSDDTQGSHISIMHADGSAITQITSSHGINGVPDWSPDGKKIVFVSDRTGNREIFVFHLLTNIEEQITHTPIDEFSTTWFDNTHILFSTSDRVNRRRSSIQILDTVSNQTSWIFSGNYNLASLRASPNRTKLAYVSSENSWRVLFVYQENESVYIMNTDGSMPVRCTTGRHDVDPTWSSDGHYLAFSSYDGAAARIYLTTTDCTAPIALTTGSAQDIDPDWSP